MGSYYRLYTEVKVGDEWICINHMYPDIEKENKEYLSVTYYSGSRSFFHETAEKLEELGHRTARSNLSRTLQERFSEFRDQENFFWCTVTDFEEMKGVIPNGYNRKENHAFVHKNTVFAYESGELDDIYDYLNAEEYGKLSETQKQVYQYYEWNDEMGWYKHFLEIIEHVKWQLFEWDWVNEGSYDEVRIVCVTT